MGAEFVPELLAPRPPVTSDLRAEIDRAFAGVDGRGALVVLTDTNGTRATFAAKYGAHWKVAAGAGVSWTGGKPSAGVAIMRVW